MAHEDDWIKDKIIRMKELPWPDDRHRINIQVLDALLKKINNLEQEVKELRNGGKIK